jgi:hypothetical protein
MFSWSKNHQDTAMRIKHLFTMFVAGMLGLLIGSCGSSGQATSPAPNIPTRNAHTAPEVTDEELLDSAGTPRPEPRPGDDSDARELPGLPGDDDTDMTEDDSGDDSGADDEFDFDEYEDDDD